MALMVIGISLLASCRGSDTTLESNTWQLVSITPDDKENQVFYGENCFTIIFCEKDSTVNGMGVCNNFIGRYESGENGKVAIEMGPITMKSCPDMDKEQTYFTMLGRTDSCKIENYELVLFHGEKECARFTPLEISTDSQTNN